MPKKINPNFNENLTFVKMYQAYLRASKVKRNRRDVIKYSIDLESNLMNLVRRIKNKTYQNGKYRVFTIKDPKKREIRALPFEDRIVHQWFIEEFIIPIMTPKFISDSYACIRGKGSHKAILKLQHYMQLMKRKKQNYYVLQCDIKKFFYNIDKEILYKILAKYFKGAEFLEFLKIILQDGLEKGIPIGNYTSQYFANIYLNELDHYIKEKLKITFYVRYMDDFILLLNSKAEASVCFNKIDKFLKNKLNLELNAKSRFFPANIGVHFCGYKVFETHILLTKRNKDKMKRKIKKWQELGFNKNNELSYNAWLGYAKHASSYQFVNKIISFIKI